MDEEVGQVLDALRRSGQWDRTVIILTSGTRPDDLKRCDELNVAAHLMKPVKQSELLGAIELARAEKPGNNNSIIGGINPQ